MCATCTAEHTDKTAASNIPRAPKSGYLVGVVDSDIGKGEIVAIGIIVVTADTNDTAVTGVVNTGIAVGNSNIGEGGVASICSNRTRRDEFSVGAEMVNCEICYSTVFYVTEQTHSVLVVIAVVVTLDAPGVLIEVENSVSVTVNLPLKFDTAL